MGSKSFPVYQLREGDWTSPSTFAIEGIPIPAFFATEPAALHDYIVNFQTRSGDVFVVSYPKSGMEKLSKILQILQFLESILKTNSMAYLNDFKFRLPSLNFS